MAVFSVMLEDLEIMNLVKDKNLNVLLIGCGGCVNESLAYVNKMPIFIASEGKPLGENPIPYATHMELERVESLIKDNGNNVRKFEAYELKEQGGSEGFLCIRNSSEKFDLFSRFSDYKIDIILTICCGAGTYGIIDDYGKDIHVYQITKATGMIGYSYIDDKNSRNIDYNHAKVLKFGSRVIK